LNKNRNRFEDNVKVFAPELKTDNYGKHSPDKLYNTIESHKKTCKGSIPFVKPSIDMQFSIPKRDR